MPLLMSATISQLIGEELRGARMGAALLAGFGLLALILASVGIYGVLSFSVSLNFRTYLRYLILSMKRELITTSTVPLSQPFFAAVENERRKSDEDFSRV